MLPIGVFNTQGTCRRLDMSCFLECGQSQKLLLRCPIQCKGNLKNQRHIKAHPSSSQHAEGMLVVKTWPRGGKDSLPSVTCPPGNRLNGHISPLAVTARLVMMPTVGLRCSGWALRTLSSADLSLIMWSATVYLSWLLSLLCQRWVSWGVDAPNAYPGRAGRGPVATLAHPVNLNVRAEDKIPTAGSTGHCNYPALLFAKSLMSWAFG